MWLKLRIDDDLLVMDFGFHKMLEISLLVESAVTFLRRSLPHGDNCKSWKHAVRLYATQYVMSS